MKRKPLTNIRYWIISIIMIGNFFLVSSYVKAEVSKEKLLYYEDRLNAFPESVQVSIMSSLVRHYFPIDREKAVHYAQRILSEFPKSTDNYKPYYVTAWQALGQYELMNKNYSEALNYFFLAIDIIDEGYNEHLRKYIYSDMGDIYYENGDYREAAKYCIKAYEMTQDEEGESNLAYKITNQLSRIYMVEEKYDSALYYTKAMETVSKSFGSRKMLTSYLYYSLIYSSQKEYNQAIYYAKRGLALEGTTPSKKLSLYLQLAQSYSSMGEFDASLEYFDLATQYLPYTNGLENYSDYHKTGADIYQNIGDLQKSNYHLSHYLETREQLEEEKQAVLRKNIQRQHLVHLKNIQIEDLQKTNVLKDADLKKNRIILYSITLLALLLITTFVLIIFMQREKFRNRRIIAAQRAELTKKQYLEELHNAELKAAEARIEGQEKERERLSKELHDGVGGTLAGIKMELESYIVSHKGDEKLKDISNLILSAYREVRSISHNFAIPDVMRGDFTDNLRNLIKNIPGKNGLHIQLSVYQEIMWSNVENYIKTEIYRIIQEAVVNIIKHAEARNAEIQIFEDEDNLNITIEDDGKGFNQNMVQKGIGLRNMKSRIEVLKGKFDIDTSPGNGTFLYFNIPLISTQ